jgi:NADH-quinone oxidoreductase subunit L
MIARTFPLWELAPAAATTAAWIGAITALMAASVAIVQTDIKKVLAYSTVSQLGYMMLAVGVGAYGAAIFLLVAHAFFKALLFLGAGSVMHGLNGVTDMRKMGGLRKKMPTTFITFLIGSAALAGIPLLSGYFAKDAVLASALDQSVILYGIGIFTALLTSFYAFRTVFLVFHGAPRDKKLVEHAHESPRLMTFPLWILAILAVLGGLINLPFVFTLDTFLEPSIGHHAHPSDAIEIIALAVSAVIALFGLYMAWVRYARNGGWVKSLQDSLSWLEPPLAHSWYFDEVYAAIIVQPLRQVSGFFATMIDPKLIDGLVNGTGNGIAYLGEQSRRLQSGYVASYALSILIGVVGVIIYFLVAT